MHGRSWGSDHDFVRDDVCVDCIVVGCLTHRNVTNDTALVYRCGILSNQNVVELCFGPKNVQKSLTVGAGGNA